MSLRDIVHHNVLHTSLTGSTGDVLRHALGVAIHRSIADDKSRLGLVTAQTVVYSHHLIYISMPDRTVGGTDIVELHASQLLQCILHRSAILADNV